MTGDENPRVDVHKVWRKLTGVGGENKPNKRPINAFGMDLAVFFAANGAILALLTYVVLNLEGRAFRCYL